MKIFTFILFIAAFAFNNAEGQNKEFDDNLLAEADKYYKEEQYDHAIPFYRELSDRSDQNASVHYQLAESYRKIFNYQEAETYYLKACYQAPEQFPLALYYYALMLKLNGDFDESIIRFGQFITLQQNNILLKEYLDQAVVDQAGSEMAKTEIPKVNAKEKKLLQSESLNSAFNDYAPAIRDSVTLVITSGRINSNRTSIDGRYGEAYTDNLYFSRNGTSWTDRTRKEFSITNSRYNDGSGSFNGKGDRYYFTVCGKGDPECHIYVCEFRNGAWSAPQILNDNVNVRHSESKHPAVSKGGDTLLFASNRKDGYGGYDIWMCLNAGNDNWGPAVNLGNGINTKLNELAPAFTSLPNLFFLASDGHQNYGGLDIYLAKRMSNGTSAIYNLDYPFNSNRDDCFITFSKNRLFFSSNREGGNGGFDIYSFPISSVLSYVSKLSLKKRDARGDVKLNGRSERTRNLNLLAAVNEDRIEYENLTYEKKKAVDRMVASRLNGSELSLKDFAGLTSDEYESLRKISEKKYQTLLLENKFKNSYFRKIITAVSDSEDVTITGFVTDSITAEKMADHKILLFDERGEVLKITTSNASGKFKFTNVPGGKTFYLRLDGRNDAAGSRYQIREVLMTKSQRAAVYGIENIYFDFDHYTLRPEAKKILEELVVYINKFPAAQVEIHAYADDLGTDDYNMVLTQRRGDAVFAYLTKMGIDQTAMAVIAKGKQKTPQSQEEMQRQLSRRVEFYINGAEENFPQETKTYLLKKKCTWTVLAAAVGIGSEELRKLNGAAKEELQLYQPVRIPQNAKNIPPELLFAIDGF